MPRPRDAETEHAHRRISATEAPWLADPAIASVMRALGAQGASPRFVGGCVRNAILAAGPTDVDVAIDIDPPETVRLLEAAQLRAIPTGVEHGTITTLAGAHPLEITSLRRDVETDGRRAVVAFTRDWAEDAARRDFTMNALYADADGRVYDPLGAGVSDLLARRVRFIGRAEDRIREDYLRILRFYRFKAWYGDGGADPHDLAATAALKDGLARLARERIGHEMRKLLAAPRPATALAAMAEHGVLDAALSGASAATIPALTRLEDALERPPRWLRRLGALLELDKAAPTADALRLSKRETQALEALMRARGLPTAEAGYRCGAEAAEDAALIEHAAAGSPPEDARAALALAADAASRRFPIAASDLLAAGMAPGPTLGAALKRAEADWIASGFSHDAEHLVRTALEPRSDA